MRASALGSQPDGMRWCDRILERMTGSHKQNSIRSSRQSSPRRKRRLPKRVYIMRRVVVLLVTVLWIVFVWLSVAGEARALFQARNLQASSNAGAADSFTTRLRNIFRECVTDIDAAQNMVVIKTLPGLGQAAAMAIDAMRAPDVVGTLGGDDTVFAVMRDNDSAQKFCKQARDILK